MSNAITRRDEVHSNLEGKVQVQPAPARPTLNLQSAGTQVPDLTKSYTAQVFESVNAFASKELQEQATREQQRRHMEGQMAAQQGMAFNDMEMAGDKWKLAGYRSMDAQTASASALSAAKTQLQLNGYQMNSAQFRESYMQQVEAATKGLDPETARMVMDQMTKQMPTLVAQHTAGNLKYQEEQAFNSMARAVNIVSADDTQTDEYIALLNGEGGAAGLSDSRRRAAVANGVVEAFDTDNPLAYAKLQQSGLLDTFTVAEQKKMRDAEERYQKKLRTNFNEAFIKEQDALMNRMAGGEFVGREADFVTELSLLMADHDMRITGVEQKQAYMSASAANEVYVTGAPIAIREAQARGDYAAVAAATEGFMVYHESRGNVNAMGPVITKGMHKGDQAMGSHQVMPKTALNPGFGIRPADINDPKDVARVGSEYWSALIHRYNGDVEAAAIGYNAGPGNADAWLEAGRDYSVLPQRSQTEPYAKGILAMANGDTKAPTFHLTGAQRVERAQDRYEAIADRIQMQNYEQLAIERDALISEFEDPNSSMSPDEFRERSNALHEQYSIAQTAGDIDSIISQINGVQDAAQDRLEENQREVLDAENAQRRLEWKTMMEDPSIPMEAKLEATKAYQTATYQAYRDAGVALADWGYADMTEQAGVAVQKALKQSTERALEDAQIRRAMEYGTVDQLDGKLQARAFEEGSKAIFERVNRDVAEGRIDEAQGRQEILQGQLGMYADAGMVDAGAAAEFSAMANQPLLDENGNPNPKVMDAISSYQQLKAMNPDVAKTMLDDRATARAEAVISAAGSTGNIADGIRALENQRANGVNFSSLGSMDPEEVQKRAAKAAEDHIKNSNPNWWDVFNGRATAQQLWNRTSKDETDMEAIAVQEGIQDEVVKEYNKLKELTPGVLPEQLMQSATENVYGRVSIVGNTAVQFATPKDGMRSQMFGTRAPEVDIEGIEDEVIVQYLRDVVAVEQPELAELISGVTSAEKAQLAAREVRWAAQGLDAIGSVFGKDWGFSIERDPEQIATTLARGVAPYTVQVHNGKDVTIWLQKPDGSYAQLPGKFPLRAAGDHWWEQNKKRQAK